MIQIEDQRASSFRYVSTGDVFEYENKLCMKVTDSICFSFTDNEACEVANDANVKCIRNVVLCIE